MLPNDFGSSTLGTLPVVPCCVCASALATLALAALASATRDAPGFDAGQTSATLSEGCSFEMLTFYYDDDGELQCECPDDVDDDDWCFERGIA